MTSLRIDPLVCDKPAYLQVADSIAARIQAGELTLRLPADRDLASQYGVAYMTMRRAAEILRERGLIITRQGRGTFVAPQTTRPARPDRPDPAYHATMPGPLARGWPSSCGHGPGRGRQLASAEAGAPPAQAALARG
jgi:GntR family transcriptional regulator